jgi:hypothetical protein
MDKGAEFSECGKYRYQLWRIWDNHLPKAMCIGLNPSTANAEDDDNTIRNLCGLLIGNGFGGLYMMNLFALISPYPEDLRVCPDPIKDNDVWLRSTQLQSDCLIFCWGSFKQAEHRSKKIITDVLIPNAMPFSYQPFCFGRNKNGSPKHPLYLKQTTKLIPYERDSKIHG